MQEGDTEAEAVADPMRSLSSMIMVRLSLPHLRDLQSAVRCYLDGSSKFLPLDELSNLQRNRVVLCARFVNEWATGLGKGAPFGINTK
jgi:hypothetical protein